MATQIHPQALVSSSSRLDEDVKIGPYVIIGDNVHIGSGSYVDSFAQVLGYTEVGHNCHIFSYAILGNTPQDLKYKGDKSYLVIGDNNQIREFVTINPGTEKNSKTVIGNNNLFMAYSHIAHDCRVGNDNVLANGATLAGYVEIGNRVVIGGLVAIHQFCRLGNFSMVGGCSKVVQDIPPYSLCDGHPAKVYGLNLVGLRKATFPLSTIKVLKKAFRLLFFQNHPSSEAQRLIKENLPPLKEIDCLLQFISSSKRGLAR